MGQGKATVLFDAGGSDWSVVWALVQPVVAKRARACSYDRAGLGYSDSDPGARTPFAIADDLHKLVHAGGISQPLILVGHSLGGFNVKLYAALFPEDVAGLVLVDPSEERTNDRMRAFLTRAWGPAVAAQDELAGHRWLAGAIDRLRACADAAERTPLDPSTPFYRRYTDPVRPALGPIIAAERTVRQVTAQYQRAQASELAFSVYGDALSDDMYSELFKPGMFGTRPLIVLAHKEDAGSDPVDIADAAGTIKLHRETALLSTLGCQETVADSGHSIELDQPQVVIAAIERVLDQVERPGLAGSVLRGHGGPSERKADLPDSKSVARSSRLAGMCEE